MKPDQPAATAARPRRCKRYAWCQHETLTRVSYGDGETYWQCPVGHVWPEPPPPDFAAIDNADAYDFEGFTP